MDEPRKVEGIDRFLLVSTALLFADLPQIALYVTPFMWPAGWIWGTICALVYSFTLNATFNMRMLGPRSNFKVTAPFFLEFLPGLGFISLLSVGIFISTYFHNQSIDEAA